MTENPRSRFVSNTQRVRTAPSRARRTHVRFPRLCASAGGNRKGYAGYEEDPALAYSIWHVRNRVLNSDLGRWTCRDLLGYVQGSNLSEYARSDPIDNVDGDGLLSIKGVEHQDKFWACGGFVHYALITQVPNPCKNTASKKFAIVGKITHKEDVTCCNNNPPYHHNKVFYELWYPIEGVHEPAELVQDGVVVGVSIPHHFKRPSSPGSRGTASREAEIRVFCWDTISNAGWGSAADAGLGEYSICGSVRAFATNKVLSTFDDWGKSVAGPVTHKAGITWDCCDCSVQEWGCGTNSAVWGEPAGTWECTNGPP